MKDVRNETYKLITGVAVSVKLYMMVHLAACCDSIFFLIICKLIDGLKFSVAMDI